MRDTDQVSYEDLRRIVESIRRFLYVDQDDDGQEVWNPDNEWSGADVCEHVANVLSLHGLVPHERQPVSSQSHHYVIKHLDGPIFRKQRELLLSLIEAAQQGKAYGASRAEQDLLNGLVNLTDAIADQAYDKHGIDCLLAPDTKCDCEKPGHFRSGVPGILAHVENGRLATDSKVERCDACERFATDQAARDRLVELGIGPVTGDANDNTDGDTEEPEDNQVHDICQRIDQIRGEAHENARAALAQLAHLGIETLRIAYDGYGDSGSVEHVTALKGDKEVDLEADLCEAIVEAAYDLVPSGWDQNEGSYGVLAVDVASRKITREHNWRVESSEYEEEVFEL